MALEFVGDLLHLLRRGLVIVGDVHEHLVAEAALPAEYGPSQREGWGEAAKRSKVSQSHRKLF